MNPLVSKSALQYFQKEFFFAEISIGLTFPIGRYSCTKYGLVSREYQVSPGTQTGVYAYV